MKLRWEVVPAVVPAAAAVASYRVRCKNPHGQHTVIYDTQNSLTLEQAHAIAYALNDLERPQKEEF